ncbi:MAG: flagellar hook-basal body complex protein FliE [Planctomycetales bacterium]|nr:flagellar hook-basal body complex protein FliE [Planctomycetales bacterium]
MNSIHNIGPAQSLPSAPSIPGSAGNAAGGASFKDFLVDSIQQVNSMQVQADKQVESLFSGGDVNPAEVLTAVQKADLAFKMMMQVRNKLVQVYQEVRDVRI